MTVDYKYFREYICFVTIAKDSDKYGIHLYGGNKQTIITDFIKHLLLLMLARHLKKSTKALP